MKVTLFKNIILVATVTLFALSNAAYANKANDENNHNAKKKLWICETNASSSSNTNEKVADNHMEKKAKSAKDAFEFALKHCRDCTKITCSVENN